MSFDENQERVYSSLGKYAAIYKNEVVVPALAEIRAIERRLISELAECLRTDSANADVEMFMEKLRQIHLTRLYFEERRAASELPHSVNGF